MSERVEVGLLDKIRPQLVSIVNDDAKRLPGLEYCDVRVQVREEKGAVAENGNEKASSEDYAFDFGVRVISGGRVTAPGFYGRILGAADIDRIGHVIMEGITQAHERARASARMKASATKRLGALGASLSNAVLAPVTIAQDTVEAVYKIDPRSVSLNDAMGMALGGCKAAQASDQVVYTAASAGTFMLRELFCSSEGADIDQSFAQTEGFVVAICAADHGTMEIYDFTGHQRGWEILTEGYDNGPIVLPDFISFCKKLGVDAVEVVNAPPLKPPDKDVTVVTDPHFNTLLVHEVVGHPSELDRALKYETSYAGRSWFFKDMKDNQMGKSIASPLVNAFSDPTMEGFGSFKYDHDGTPARRAYHIRDGVMEEFLNNRQTAAILGAEANGSSRATEASLVPLIRMTNTVFAPGEQDPQQIISEVEDGYYVSGHRIPSVSEARENFRITAVKVYEIKNGQLGQLYRDGGITSDSRDYFMSIDAVGSDFKMYPVPNCGKGQPMQAKRMSNGGPTMRGIARLTGPAA